MRRPGLTSGGSVGQRDSGRVLILEAATKKESPEAHVSPKEAIRASMKAVGLGP